MKKHTLLVAILCILTNALKAQELTSTRYWLNRGADTIYCKKIRSGSMLFVGARLIYTTNDDQKVKLSGPEECKEAKSFGIGATTFDLVPIKPGRPKNMSYMPRIVDGTVVVNFHVSFHTSTPSGSPFHTTNDPYPDIYQEQKGALINDPGSFKYYFFKLPDGTYYQYSHKNMKEVIVPFLNECERVRINYEDQKLYKYAPFTVVDMVKTYNKECDTDKSIQSQSLTSTRCWYQKGEDTIYCKKFLSEHAHLPGGTLSYVTADNKIVFLSKEDCKNLKCYGIGPEIFDLIQVNPKRPDHIVFVKRYSDGALRVNTAVESMFYVRMPDGTYYLSSGKNIKNTILPFLNTCERIRANYTDQKSYDYSTQYILDMILAYNKECPQAE